LLERIAMEHADVATGWRGSRPGECASTAAGQLGVRPCLSPAPSAVQELVRTGGSTLTACDDGPASASPTCGFVLDAAGARVPASQGFCCSCSAAQLLRATTGIRAATGAAHTSS